jgi:peptide deformylase
MKDSVVQMGASVLRDIAKPVAQKEFGTKELAVTIKKMQKLVATEEFGVAIAAPQIGVSKRIFILADKAFDASMAPDKIAAAHKVFINPEIMRLSRKKEEMAEGCLSVRGKYGTVIRHEKASVRAYTQEGKVFVYHGTGLIAQIFQHEHDHLDGILYVDKAEKLRNEKTSSPLKKEVVA